MLNLATIRDLFDVRTITQTELPELPEYQISMMIMLECRLLQIDYKTQIAMCDRKLRCLCGTHFGCNLRCACVQCILRFASATAISHTFLAVMKEMLIQICFLSV